MIQNSVIITVYNKFDEVNKVEKFLRPCLDSVIAHTNLEKTEIIVVGSGMGEETYRALVAYSRHITFISSPIELSFAQACNLGIRVAKGEFIILLNDDTVILPSARDEWINRLTTPFVDPWVGLTGVSELVWMENNESFLLGFCLGIRREVVSSVGYLDETFACGGAEDIDFCLRAKQFGWRLVCVSKNESELVPGNEKLVMGDFPLYHHSNATTHQTPDWESIFGANMQLLTNRVRNGYYK